MADSKKLELRIEKIEQEIASLKSHLSKNSSKPWWQKISGVFENDPDFDEIISLGQDIRKQERPNGKS